jgi:hypothetical protein
MTLDRKSHRATVEEFKIAQKIIKRRAELIDEY